MGLGEIVWDIIVVFEGINTSEEYWVIGGCEPIGNLDVNISR